MSGAFGICCGERISISIAAHTLMITYLLCSNTTIESLKVRGVLKGGGHWAMPTPSDI